MCTTRVHPGERLQVCPAQAKNVGDVINRNQSLTSSVADGSINTVVGLLACLAHSQAAVVEMWAVDERVVFSAVFHRRRKSVAARAAQGVQP